METDEKILDKVRKLLALAEHPNTNEHEASLAYERAQELILKHNIDHFRLSDVADVSAVVRGDMAVTVEQWTQILIGVVARDNFCQAIKVGRFDIAIIGRPHNVEFTRELFSWLRIQVEAISDRAVAGYSGPISSRKWANSFRHGMVDRIAARLRERRAEQEAMTTAIVVRSDDENNDFIAHEFGRLRKGSARRDVTYGAYTAGRGAADGVSLSPASRQVEV